MKPVNLPKQLTLGQKIFAGIIAAGLIYGGLKIFNNYLAPLAIDAFENFWHLVLLGVPALFLVYFVLKNPFFIWAWATTLSRSITDFMIKQDPLSIMDRYIEWLGQKLGNLTKSIEILKGKKIKLDRRVDSLQKEKQTFLNLGLAAQKQGEMRAAALNGGKAASLTTSIAVLMPLKNRTDMAIEKMTVIEENWRYSLDKTAFEVQNKREEYEMIKEVTKGLKSADDFINSDSEEARVYGVSLKALEERVTSSMGFIEDFDRRSKDLVTNISIEKQANMDEGLKVLEDYMNESNLLLSNDKVGSQLPKQKQFNLLGK